MTDIGGDIVSGCKLKSLTIGNGIISKNYSLVTFVVRDAFPNCSTIKILDGVTSIGNYVFYGCTSLSKITIPDSVTSIGDYAFYKCTSLSEVTIPKNVSQIGTYAFADSGLTQITFEDTDSTWYYSINQTSFIVDKIDKTETATWLRDTYKEFKFYKE